MNAVVSPRYEPASADAPAENLTLLLDRIGLFCDSALNAQVTALADSVVAIGQVVENGQLTRAGVKSYAKTPMTLINMFQKTDMSADLRDLVNFHVMNVLDFSAATPLDRQRLLDPLLRALE